uniref:Uncharacterized protein n=1 Tax=Nelumbo nucifera TaxID=4432 RepID=A0A822YIB2_NELNU|nr:TPA_asm: hypothetical protein HUJ06_011171 [Nelumbo nucifera]
MYNKTNKTLADSQDEGKFAESNLVAGEAFGIEVVSEVNDGAVQKNLSAMNAHKVFDMENGTTDVALAVILATSRNLQSAILKWVTLMSFSFLSSKSTTTAAHHFFMKKPQELSGLCGILYRCKRNLPFKLST